jgi:hypothetical protein
VNFFLVVKKAVIVIIVARRVRARVGLEVGGGKTTQKKTQAKVRKKRGGKVKKQAKLKKVNNGSR